MAESSNADDPATIVRSYLDAFASADPETIAGHVSDDFVNEHTSALGQGCTGRKAYRDALPDFLRDMAGLRYQVESLMVDGAQVGVFYTLTALWQGTKPISIRGAQRFTIRHGRIARRVDYWDSGSFLMQADDEAREMLARFGLG